MLLVTLTSAAILAAASSSQVPPSAESVAAGIAVAADVNPHLQNARAALEKGDVTLARREYRFAQLVDRDAGVIPVEASQGLAGVLFAQEQPREAAEVMLQLAEEAARAGEIDLEARALVSATWLQLECGDRSAARQGVRRLHEIARDTRISSATRSLLKHSIG